MKINKYGHMTNMAAMPVYGKIIYIYIFKHFHWNHWAVWSQISSGAAMGWGTTVCSWGPGHLTKIAAMSI